MKAERGKDGRFPSYAWPGGYEIHYITADGGVLCFQCANQENGSEASEELDPSCPWDDQWRIIGCDVNWEEEKDSPLYCDHCNRRIEPEYGIIGVDV